MTEEQRDQTHVETHGDDSTVNVENPGGDTGSTEDLESSEQEQSGNDGEQE